LSFLVPVTALAVSLSAIAACDDETAGVGGELDPATAQSLVDGIVDGLVDDSESLQTLIGGLGDLITDLTSIQDPPPLAADAAPSLIPGALLGSTCAWDFTGSSWFDDTSRTGAPEDGIRFVLYRVDTMGMPISEGEEFGDIDIRDLTQGDNIEVDISAREAGASVMDYYVTGTLTEVSYDLTAAGFLSDGTNTQNFSFSTMGSASGESAAMDIPVGAFELSAELGYDGSTFTQVASIVETVSGSSLVYTLIYDDTGVVDPSSGVELNGEKIAEFTSAEFLELVPVEGSGLTTGDITVLENVYDGISTLFFTGTYLLEFGLDNTGRVLPPR
jgi:hypothetical protein